MKIGIAIPTQNKRPEMLSECLESIYAQTRKPDAIAISCTQGSYIDRINDAVKSLGDVDAFVLISDDDKLASTFLEETEALMQDKRCDIVATWLQNFGEEDTKHGPGFYPFITSLCKKSLFDINKFDTNAGAFADIDFWQMCKNNNAKVEVLGKPLFLYRKHGGQSSHTADFSEATKKFLLKHNLKCMP